MRVSTKGLILAFSFSASALAQSRFENFPVTLEALPREVLAPIPIYITTDQFQARLKERRHSAIRRKCSKHRDSGGPWFDTTRPVAFLALDVLELSVHPGTG